MLNNCSWIHCKTVYTLSFPFRSFRSFMIKFLTDPTFSIKMTLVQFIIELYNAQPRQFYRRRWVTAVSSRLFKRSKIRLVSRSVSGFQKWSCLQVFERVKKKNWDCMEQHKSRQLTTVVSLYMCKRCGIWCPVRLILLKQTSKRKKTLLQTWM